MVLPFPHLKTHHLNATGLFLEDWEKGRGLVCRHGALWVVQARTVHLSNQTPGRVAGQGSFGKYEMITRPYGITGQQVTVLGLGGAFIDNVSFDTGIATVRRALELDIGYIDTSPGYCEGRS